MNLHLNLTVTLLAGLLLGTCGTDAVADDCESFAVADNGQFTVELVKHEYLADHNWVVLYYEVCVCGESPEVKDLSHWCVDLHSFAYCLKPGCKPHDLIPICGQTAPYQPGEEHGEFIREGTDDPYAPVPEIGVDPTTGVPGLKFDELELGDWACQSFAFVIDLNCIRHDCKITEGCVEVAFKAGRQDVRRDGEQPGYAHVLGPVCVDRNEDNDEEVD